VGRRSRRWVGRGSPASGSDTEHRTFGRADHVTPEAFADVIVGVRDIVG